MTLLTKFKVVFDTNVFVSGLVFGGNCEKILRLFKDEQIELLISPQTHTEVLKKLPHFGLGKKYFNEQNAQIQAKATRVFPRIKINVCRDPKDDIFLELCLAGNANYLITGDKDLLDLKSYRSTLILSPKEFLKILS
ncbi:putative toxin-antitoxin system toxin component, PIN family [Candidatus Gottesmanbacteria bacterium RIFCSPLOWO2_02_FULL_38_8]|uniref:Putative toxin-antitoxin system toxin component, PIN family n=1 Tax=Candidatus Gottesmanbacteria bacterium RIFCSPLOWO2_02_FULL_38_8 TaxID=1798397 RepID=A0A1F6B2S1_9BACT|nr:MAG: putative toxin-antitoxin system toxin component, PIN family [Candidatus Gottesmanbacteria bacterium RIFCSPLOWO2_02_FULL_38_8]